MHPFTQQPAHHVCTMHSIMGCHQNFGEMHTYATSQLLNAKLYIGMVIAKVPEDVPIN